ncbi:CerR family C-terminal domain-containing protein [Morganella morganii subsp. morganii]|nr:CerR family C-terminal domain-containing protein [Morganella morganii subsp. morganii]
MTEKMNKHTLSSEQTREKLIQAGIRLFALSGVSGVRTRQLAEEAGVNQSAIPYHLGGKSGVYAAVIRKITDDLAAVTDVSRIDAATEALTEQAQPGKTALKTVLVSMVTGLCKALLSPERALYGTLILREQLEQTENYDVIYQSFIEPFHKRLSLLAQLADPPADTKTTIIRAHALIGQILGFVVARKAYLCRSEAESVSEDELAEITGQIVLLSCRALGLDEA